MKSFLSTILLFSIIFNSIVFAQPVTNYMIKGEENNPAIISADKIMNISSEVSVIKPYKTSTEGIRDELLIYRNIYIFFALFQGYVLIKAAARQ